VILLKFLNLIPASQWFQASQSSRFLKRDVLLLIFYRKIERQTAFYHERQICFFKAFCADLQAQSPQKDEKAPKTILFLKNSRKLSLTFFEDTV
jgi:hypothetical protein